MGRNKQWHVVLEQATADGEPCVLWSKGPDTLEITHSLSTSHSTAKFSSETRGLCSKIMQSHRKTVKID